MNEQAIATVTDASTGYSVKIARLDRPDFDVQYNVEVFSPVVGEEPSRLLDGIDTVPLRSDGTGHAPLHVPRSGHRIFDTGSPEAARAADEMFGAQNTTTGNLVMNPGVVLPNGAVIIAASAAKAHEWIILALRPGYHASDSYCTWACPRPSDGKGTHTGGYFDKLEDALADYKRRIERFPFPS
jgi:hypothetical protein